MYYMSECESFPCLVRVLGLDPKEQEQLLVARTYNLTVVYPPTLTAQFSGACFVNVCVFGIYSYYLPIIFINV